MAAKNDKRFRLKRRPQRYSYGAGFAARAGEFADDVYLEWQIGYDALIRAVTAGEKQTSLGHLKFAGANGDEKHPYELAELLHACLQHDLIERRSVAALENEILEFNVFLDREKIVVGQTTPETFCGINFQKASITLPAYFVPLADDGEQIEVAIQKQQYATGVQPMVYLCIPFRAFANAASYAGRSAKMGETLKYVITRARAQGILTLFRVFASCSASHNHDIREILRAVLSDFRA